MRHYFLLTNPSIGGKIQFIFYWNWMMTVFSLHISTTLHLTIFGIWSNNIQSVQHVICVMIVRGLWYIGLAIRYTIWIVAHLCISRGTFLRINGKTTLSPLDATDARRWRCSSCQSYIYVCRICNYLFCIHAKFYKHISPSYYKPDAQSLKFYWRCSYWILSQFNIQAFHKL